VAQVLGAGENDGAPAVGGPLVVNELLLTAAIDCLWALRRAAFERMGYYEYRAALDAMALLDVAELDLVVSTRADQQFDLVTFEHAIGFVDDSRLLLDELQVVRHLPAERVKSLRDHAKWELRRRARNPKARPAITGASDFSRHWRELMEYVENTLSSGRSRGDRRKATLDRADGLIILLSNTSEAVPQETFHMSVSLAAGILP